ncbi:MAG: GNAT family N-acetyltransferase [Candidatus Thorarchaeota archaeon]|jgi:ribosomal-protein-alanine N-acetyltransferase
MIRVKAKKLSSEECKILAQITIDARSGTVLESKTSIEDRISSIAQLSENDAFKILVAFDEEDTIVGWTYYYVAFPLMTFISGFYPIVDSKYDAEEIALALIEAGKKEILERGHTRLEIELELPTEAHRTESTNIVDWYKKAGFKLATEEVHMTTDLTSVELPNLELPNGYILRRFSEVPIERLIQSGYEIFNDSSEDLFRSMSHDEKRINLEYWFDKDKPYHEEASLVLEKDDKMIGFVLSKPEGEQAEIGPVGLIRESRGQGLGTILLGTSLKHLKEDSVKIAALDTSRNNNPSRKLYTKFGFNDVYYKQFYYWSP